MGEPEILICICKENVFITKIAYVKDWVGERLE